MGAIDGDDFIFGPSKRDFVLNRIQCNTLYRTIIVYVHVLRKLE